MLRWCFTVALFLLMRGGEAQWLVDDEGCRTPDRGVGTCLPINSCQPILDVFMESPRPMPDRLVEYLRSFQCGVFNGQAKVCCPDGPIVNALVSGYPDVSGHRNLGLLPRDVCGQDIDEDKIIGGNKTGVFEFPWMALISYRTDQGYEFKCGGSIINNRYILTAAHCITNLENITLAGVRIGEHNVETPTDCDTHPDYITKEETKVCADPPQDLAIEESVPHPKYDAKNIINDIGLIRLRRNIDLNTHDNIKPICLPWSHNYTSYNYTGRMVTVAGWGATESRRASAELLKVFLPVIPNAECIELYKKSGKPITKKQMCAGGLNGKDSCQGDSGGPLMVKMQKTVYDIRTFQMGIVSYGPQICAVEGLPAVYSNVGQYMDWILDTLRP